MPNFISDFFENRGWLRLVQHNSTSGRLQVAGTNIDPYEFTLAQFQGGLVSSDYAGIEIRITDIHTTAAGVGGVRFTGGASWVLTSPRIYYSTFAAAIAAFPAASYTNLVIRCGDVGNGRIDLISNGARYLPKEGRANLSKNVYGTVATPTNNIPTGSTTYQFSIGTPTFPANLFATPDTLILTLRFQRHNANATMTVRASLGTAGDATDDSLYLQTVAATDNIQGAGFVFAEISSSTKYITNTANGTVSAGAASYLLDKTTNFNTASIMKLAITGTKNTNDTIDLLSYSLDWVAV